MRSVIVLDKVDLVCAETIKAKPTGKILFRYEL